MKIYDDFPDNIDYYPDEYNDDSQDDTDYYPDEYDDDFSDDTDYYPDEYDANSYNDEDTDEPQDDADSFPDEDTDEIQNAANVFWGDELDEYDDETDLSEQNINPYSGISVSQRALYNPKNQSVNDLIDKIARCGNLKSTEGDNSGNMTLKRATIIL
nr:hypothetical protein [uncultured Anaerotignum sp.]